MKNSRKTAIPFYPFLFSTLALQGGHWILLKFFGADFSRDQAFFLISTLAMGGLFFSFGALFSHILSSLGLAKRGVHAFWNFLVFLSLYFVVEYVCQTKLQIGLLEALSLLPESFFSRGALYTSLWAQSLGWLVVGLVLTFIFSRLRKGIFPLSRTFLVPVSGLLLTAAACTFYVCAEPHFCNQLASEKACKSLSKTSFHFRGQIPAIRKLTNVVIPGKMDRQTKLRVEAELAKIDLKEKPNIYIVIVDSMRSDVVGEGAMPYLSAEMDKALSLKAISPSNCTHTSWYSIFGGTEPLLWKSQMVDPSTEGVTPLNWFKKLGYQIHLITSQSLHPHKKQAKIFGDSNRLLSSFTGPQELENGIESSWALSGRAVQRLIQLREKNTNKGANLYVLALFAPHWPYSLGENQKIKFQPYSPTVNLSEAVNPNAESLNLLRNRYLNSISFVDESLKHLWKDLKSKGEWDNSLIFVFGDHGESFEEQKPIFHCSGLNNEQLETRLLVKAPKNKVPSGQQLNGPVTTLDILPTAFDVLGVSEITNPHLAGETLLNVTKENKSRILASLHGGKSSPLSLRLSDGVLKGYFELEGPLVLGKSLRVQEVRLMKMEKEGLGDFIPSRTEVEIMMDYFYELMQPQDNSLKLALKIQNVLN